MTTKHVHISKNDDQKTEHECCGNCEQDNSGQGECQGNCEHEHEQNEQAEVKETDSKSNLLNNRAFAIVLTVLTLLSLVQTAQSYSLYSKIKDGNFGSKAPAAGAGDALPDMVGGC